MRADAARYLYMHKYGGLYSDLDIEALTSFDQVFNTTTTAVLLAYMGTDYKYPHNIPNAFMASKPGYVEVVVLWVMTTSTDDNVCCGCGVMCMPKARACTHNPFYLTKYMYVSRI